MDLSRRLYRVLRTLTEDRLSTLDRIIERGDAFLDERLREWEEKLGLNDQDEFSTSNGDTHYNEPNYARTDSAYSVQFVEDLRLFDLEPPSSLQEVKKARNREMKVFHPDKYLNDPDKLEIANQIVQIYNDAYERLKGSFGS